MALVTLSVIASVVAALLIGRFAATVFASAWSGAAAAIVVLLSPAMLVFGPLPNAESVAVALVAMTFVCLAERRGDLFALFAALSIAARPQIAPAMIAVVIAGLYVFHRLRMATIFVVVLAASFVPIVEAVGAARLVEWLGVRVTFDRDLVVRFIAHPWGGKYISFPLLAFAGAGAVVAFRRYRNAVTIALVLFGLVHTLLAMLCGDPLDGVRPVLPALIAVGFFAIASVARWPVVAIVLSGAFAAGSVAYTWPVTAARRLHSPAVVAARQIPAASAVVADPDLAPFARRALTPERLDEIVGRNPLRLYLLMHGRSGAAGARHFEWPDSDAYGKLTTERYRVVSLIPLPPGARYAARSGVYAYESSPEYGEWRWLQPRASIRLPSRPAKDVVFRFRLPADAPIYRNRVNIGAEQNRYVNRGETVEIFAPPQSEFEIVAQRSFRSADGRDLAIQLVGIEGR